MSVRDQQSEGLAGLGRWVFASIIVLGAILLSAGCSSEISGTKAAPKLEACTLLSAEDVATVLGANAVVTEADRHGKDSFWMSSCRYHAKDADGTTAASLMIRPHHNVAGAEQAYADYDDELAGQIGESARLAPVEGPWQQAGWQRFGTSIGQLAIFQGPYHLIITAQETAGHDQLENSRALAERALARLPLP
ncbi:MAG: hypothetical protein WBM40_21365 [Thiohalocapsa sp.]